jgi:hypothetical protein
VASGVYSTSRYLGSINGTSLLAARPATYAAGGFGLLFAVLVAAASVAALLALALPGGSSRASAALGSRSHGRQCD